LAQRSCGEEQKEVEEILKILVGAWDRDVKVNVILNKFCKNKIVI